MNSDIISYISLYLSDKDLVSWSSCNKYFRDILDSEDYYLYRFRNLISKKKEYSSYKEYGKLYIFYPIIITRGFSTDTVKRIPGIRAKRVSYNEAPMQF